MIRRVTLALRVLLGAVFIYAAYTKLRQSWLLFALSIDSYQLLPEWAVFALARTLPALELALGVLLIAGVWLRYLSIVAAAILALFFSVMVVSYFRGAGIDCGCFGVGEPLVGENAGARRRRCWRPRSPWSCITRRQPVQQSLIPKSRVQRLVAIRLVRMLVVDRRRIVVGEVIVLGRRARLPVVPRALGINRVHPPELFDAFAVRILGFSHRVS